MVNNIEDNTIYTFSEILHPSSQSFKILTRQKIGEKKKELLRWDYNNGFLIIEEGEGFSVKRKYQFLEKGKTIRFFACETAPTKCKRKGEDETMTLLKL